MLMVILLSSAKKRIIPFFKFVKLKMLPSSGNSYQDAINTLNTLQTNLQYLQSAIVKPKGETNLGEVEKFLNRTGLTLDELDKLSVVHIAGTNGKGTTCAYCESILRYHGFKTGFYSSPHLLDVRERIRIDGKPISKEEFALQFWKIYNLLEKQKTNPTDMPLYFRYLTILALHVFLENKVDVAILEVGIGGEYDCTNIIRKTAVAGITPLDLDHTSLLGHSIESIAWNKSGIMKKGTMVFTTKQSDAIMKILKERSVEKKCSLSVIEKDSYEPINNFNIPPHVQRQNANLALAISRAYITYKLQSGDKLKKQFDKALSIEAIEKTVWPGRYEIKNLNTIKFFLDGAHTMDSMNVCINWFINNTKTSSRKRVLIFNLTGNRLADVFFKSLCKLKFNTVIFSPNIGNKKYLADTTDFIMTSNEQLIHCNQLKHRWLKEENMDYGADNVLILPSFSEAVAFLNKGGEYDVLVTGSIHLIGAALSILDPTLGGTLDE